MFLGNAVVIKFMSWARSLSNINVGSRYNDEMNEMNCVDPPSASGGLTRGDSPREMYDGPE